MVIKDFSGTQVILQSAAESGFEVGCGLDLRSHAEASCSVNNEEIPHCCASYWARRPK